MSIDTESLRIAVERVPLDKLYIGISSSKDQDVKSVAFSWNPYNLLKRLWTRLSSTYSMLKVIGGAMLLQKVLSKVIIVVATKTHTYPRILKAVGSHFANPEITAYYHLNTKELSNINAVASRYLAVTTSAWRESFEGGLTVKPTLLTIVTSKETANQQNIENILRYTITLCILNNTSTWIHSLPWPLHRVDKILKTAHRLAQTQDKIVATLKNKEIAKIL